MIDRKVGYVFEPVNKDKIPILKASPKFRVPASVDLRDYCTITDNQGQAPECAAFTAANYAENIRWRLNDFIETIDPHKIYKFAKTVDGLNGGDGTTLDAVAKALLNYKILPGTESNIKIIWNDNLNDIKYAIHKYGVVMTAFNITEDWFTLSKGSGILPINGNGKIVGGHAILGCGYNRDGLFIQNSWGIEWGDYGFALIPWNKVQEHFIYGCTITNVLNNLN